MKRLIFLCLMLAQLNCLSFAQTTYYHILNTYCASCDPVVEIWNVSAERARANGYYVEEYTDSAGRVSKLLFYYKGIQRRNVIDVPDYVCYEYGNSSITVTVLYALKCWYPEFEYVAEDTLYAIQYTFYYKSYIQDFYMLTDGYEEYISGKDYYARQLMEMNIVSNYEEAIDYLNKIPLSKDANKKIQLDDIENYDVPYYIYSFCKNGPGNSVPRGWNVIWGVYHFDIYE